MSFYHWLLFLFTIFLFTFHYKMSLYNIFTNTEFEHFMSYQQQQKMPHLGTFVLTYWRRKFDWAGAASAMLLMTFSSRGQRKKPPPVTSERLLHELSSVYSHSCLSCIWAHVRTKNYILKWFLCPQKCPEGLNKVTGHINGEKKRKRLDKVHFSQVVWRQY